MKNLLFIPLVLVTATAALAQETIFTDRPNVTDAVGVISPGTFQIEAGFLYSDYSSTSAFDIPNINIKYGLVERLELRILTTYQSFHTELVGTSDNTTTGFTPITFSPKLALTEQNGWIPKTALVAGFTFPNLAKEAFDIDEFQGSLAGLFEYTWGKVTWTNSLTKMYTQEQTGVAYTTVVGVSLSDKLGAYVELFGAAGSEFDTSYNLDWGLTYLISDRVQIDALYGTTLQDNDYYFFGFGAAWKTNFKD